MLGVYRIFRQAQICWYSNNTSCGVEKIQYPVWHFLFKPHFYWWSAIPPFLWWKIHVLSLLVPWPQSVVGHWESQKRLGTRTVSQSIPCSRCMTATPEYRMIQSCGLVYVSMKEHELYSVLWNPFDTDINNKAGWHHKRIERIGYSIYNIQCCRFLTSNLFSQDSSTPPKIDVISYWHLCVTAKAILQGICAELTPLRLLQYGTHPLNVTV